jgi:copper chaperone
MQTTYVTIIGLTEGDRTSTVTEILSGLPGVGDVKVSASGGDVTIDFNETRISVSRLNSALEEAGFELRADAARAHKRANRDGAQQFSHRRGRELTPLDADAVLALARDVRGDHR